MRFTPENIEALFGKEAAENEDPVRLQKYFFKSRVYNAVRADIPLRVLVSHKGIGKSAMFKVCYLEDERNRDLALWVRPDDLLEIPFPGTDNFNQLIRNWKEGITSILVRKVSGYLSGDPITDSGIEMTGRTVGAVVNDLLSLASRKLPAVGNETKRLTIGKFLSNKKIIVYVDDLDRGWEGKREDIRNISALLNALRDLTTDYPKLHFRVALRADVYFLVRTSDESTDKIDGSVIWYMWSNHELYKILIKRIAAFFGEEIDESYINVMSQQKMAFTLNRIMEPRFQGRGHWENAPMYKVLLSLVRKRPRDLVKLCSEAANSAYHLDHEKIATKDLLDSFERYSLDRLQDTINEYRTELPDIERLLFGMRPAQKERRAALGYQYNTADLLKKIETVIERGAFRFANGKLAAPRDLAGFMYKINFLTARKELSSGRIDRKYFDENRYIMSNFVDFGYDWEIHPAYRWALQPEDISTIFQRLQLSSFEFDDR